MKEVAETMGNAIPLKKLCAVLGIPRSTVYRMRKPTAPQAPHRPPRALSEGEKATVLEVLNSERFADLAPRQVYGVLLDEGEYSCSISSLYRILREHNELNERSQQRTHPTYRQPEWLATTGTTTITSIALSG